MLAESDARTLRQFLVNTFDGIGGDAADQILDRGQDGHSASPGKLKPRRSSAARRDAEREPQRRPVDAGAALRQPRAAAVSARRVRDYPGDHGDQLALLRPDAVPRQLPSGPVTVMVHMASVWVPFTSESKEAIAGYPEIQKELRLGLQAVGRKLAMYLNRRNKVKQEGERRNRSSCVTWAKVARP